jgi:Acyl-CoA dehydrogenase, C-terminal domain
MDFALTEQTQQLDRELSRWVERRSSHVSPDGFDPEGWKELVGFGLPGLTASGGTDIDLVVGVMAASRAGLPGPVVEAQLALESPGTAALRGIDSGKVVTSVTPDGERSIVGWGAVADLVVDQRTGTTLSDGPLPIVRSEYAMPHGWLEHPNLEAGDDTAAPRRWLLSAAAVAGLGRGALERAVKHTVDRQQFGRSLASFQAVQFRLAECLNLLEGLRLCVLDAAWRFDTGRTDAAVASALTWLWADSTAEAVADHTHQVFGALGFCTETGLVILTSQMSWFRLTAGQRQAVALVTARRARRAGTPPSRVMSGFVSA